MIAYQITGEQIIEAYEKNIYVSYWVKLMFFFAGVAVISFIGLIITKPKVVDEGMQVYENRQFAGSGPVDEYVAVRVKKDELFKLKSS